MDWPYLNKSYFVEYYSKGHLWHPHGGRGGGQAQVDGVKTHVDVYREKFESTDVILSSSHAKKLASFFTRISSLDEIKSRNFSAI